MLKVETASSTQPSTGGASPARRAPPPRLHGAAASGPREVAVLSRAVPVALQVYQIYAKRPPEEVHTLLRALGADYVILEDSICYERRHPRGCRLRDLLDVANGHVSTRLPEALAPAPGFRRACWESRVWSPPLAGLAARGRREAASVPKFMSNSTPVSAGFQQEALHKIAL